MPPQHLSLGFAGGSVSSLLFSLLRDWSHHHPSVPVLPEPIVDRICDCHCGAIFANLDVSEKDIGLLLIGALLGLLLLPVLELLLVLRQALSLWIRDRVLGLAVAKQLYRPV